MTDNLLFAENQTVNLDAAYLFVLDSGNAEIFFPGAVTMRIPGVWDRVKLFAAERDHVISAGPDIYINTRGFISVQKVDMIDPTQRSAPVGMRIQFRTADKDSAVRIKGDQAIQIWKALTNTGEN